MRKIFSLAVIAMLATTTMAHADVIHNLYNGQGVYIGRDIVQRDGTVSHYDRNGAYLGRSFRDYRGWCDYDAAGRLLSCHR